MYVKYNFLCYVYTGDYLRQTKTALLTDVVSAVENTRSIPEGESRTSTS